MLNDLNGDGLDIFTRKLWDRGGASEPRAVRVYIVSAVWRNILPRRQLVEAIPYILYIEN